MINIKLGEWMWRFVALIMLFTAGWTMWVMYQLNPPPLILNEAFVASSLAKANANQAQKPSVQGVITPPAVTGEPPKSADAAPSSASSAAPSAAEPAKPAPEAPVAAKPSNTEVIDTVEAWARAWSSKEVDAYLAFYAKNFKTPAGKPRGEWEKSRRQRIGAPKSITVTIDAPSVSAVADDLVNVTFKQGYRSDVITSSITTKTLVMVKTDGRWLIQQENAGN